MKDLVDTALGAILIACLCLAVLLLPSALIDVVAGTNLLNAVLVALLAGLSAAALLGVVVVRQERYSDGKTGRRSSNKTADARRAADNDYEKDWRRR